MGYSTRHSLVVQLPVGYNGTEMDIINELRTQNESAEWALQPDGSCEDECKWYEHEKDMRAFSKQYPDVIFCLHGIGEDSDDQWNQYYKDGKMQNCKAIITFEEYNETKLR